MSANLWTTTADAPAGFTRVSETSRIWIQGDLIEQLGRAVAKVHCVSDADSDQSLVDWSSRTMRAYSSPRQDPRRQRYIAHARWGTSRLRGTREQERYPGSTGAEPGTINAGTSTHRCSFSAAPLDSCNTPLWSAA